MDYQKKYDLLADHYMDVTGDLFDSCKRAKIETELWAERKCDCSFPSVCGCAESYDG